MFTEPVEDFHDFDYVLCMDRENLKNLQKLQPSGSRAVLSLLGSFDPQGESIIEDPYYGGPEGFEANFQQIKRCCNHFLDLVSSA